MTFNCTLTHMVLNLSEENTYLHFLSFLNTKSAQVAEILPHDWLGPFCPALSIPMLLMTWRLKEPGHQQQWYWHIPEYYGYPTKWCIRISKLQYMTWWYSISACNVMPINCWADQSHQLWQMSPMTTRHVGFMPWYQWNPIHNHVYAPVQGVMIVNGWGIWLWWTQSTSVTLVAESGNISGHQDWVQNQPSTRKKYWNHSFPIGKLHTNCVGYWHMQLPTASFCSFCIIFHVKISNFCNIP